ncbi:retention module-containing protein [Geomonas nitrogeniifigens]|uniref:retention module-containing protein n=1 Tax=Geomonas diazotrophica TaxID=2843197 RepID=UPI001C2C822D|nr:retention module-containing protein [Geomonas nitrogeniifigens]QXE85396.1 retention module-containing protein [Geomonas nitrogeniifigens]
MAQNDQAAAAGAGNQVVGKVVILYGTVKAISPDGAIRLLMPNSPIFANDRIVTESDGSVSIAFDGAQGNHLDLGRMTNVAIDHDVYGTVTAGDTTDTTAEVQQIQQALATGDQPIELEAPAAGGPADAGGTHPVFILAPTGEEVLPTAGVTTTGVTFGSTGTIDSVITETVAPPTVPTTNTVVVTAPTDVNEGGDITYTATTTHPAQGDITVTLSNGSSIIIPNGGTSGTVHVPVHPDNPYIDAGTVTTTVTSATGGTETVVVDHTPVVTQVHDIPTPTTVTLAVSPVAITEAGATVTYTATLTNVAHGDVTVHLDNGQTITIADGHTTGSVDHTFANADDVYVDPSNSSVAITSASGGNFEQIVVDGTPATVHIADTVNDTTVSLAVSPASVTEAGATVTYTATLTNAAHGDVTVHLANGQTITIADGHTTGTVDHTFANTDDVYTDPSSSSTSITSASGGNFENLVVDSTPVTVQIADTVNDTTVSLAVSPASITEAGATVTYTATLTNAAHGDVTVHLDNGQTITIADGHTTGTVDHTFANTDDVYVDPSGSSVAISSASGGNFENLVVDHTAATVSIADTVNDTTVSLAVSPASITEAGATVTYTATLTNAAHGDVTVHLDNGQSITIADGHTTGTVDHTFANIDDVYVDPSSSATSITSASGGNFENLVVDSTPVTVQIADTVNDTTVSLAVSPASITEAGATVTYTATLTSAAHGDVTVHLDNGQTITIADGHTTGTVDHTFANTDDVYVDPTSSSVAISNASGGNFENLVVDSTPVTVQIADTVNDTTVSLAVSPASITEAGATVTYTATLTNAAHGDVTVHLDNGQTITIADGHTTGTVDHTFANTDDVYVDPSSSSVAITSASGGNFENLVVDHTAATVSIADTVNDTTVSLGVSPASITEAGATVTYTATLTNAAHGDVTVHLDNGQTITIADGHTTGTVDHTFANIDDVYVGPSSSSVAISNASGGNFENLVVDSTPVTVQIADTVNDTTVSLAVSPASITEAGATVTYTATLTNAAHGDVTVHLDNGQTITIADGHSTGTVDHTFASSDDVYVDPSDNSVTISSASGGNFENLVVDHTAATVHIADTINDTTVSLGVSPASITEAGATVTYTATLTNAAHGDVTVHLDNGQTITIADGHTTGTVDHTFANTDDVYVDPSNSSVAISSASGGNFENLVVDATPATVHIADTINDTTVSLAVSPASITEAGATVTYTATLTNAAHGDVTVHLDNGQTITIADGHTTGTVDHTFANTDDVYVDPTSSSVAISSASGGNFENLVVDHTAATVHIADTINDTTVSLGVSPASITEAGATVTYTATLTNAAHGDVTVHLDNGQTITIADGHTTGTVDHTFASSDDVYVDPSDNSVTISSASGGNFENLVVDHTAATVHIADTINDTTVSLGVSPASITEAGATVTYTATLTNAAHGDVTVHLDNGQTITIADGHTTGTVDHTFANTDDVYVDPTSSSVAISSASGGNFENLVVDHTAATVSIADTVNDTTVSLGVSPASITEAGATVTYTATLTNAAHGDVTVHLDNGQTITIADGHTTGTVDHTFASSDDVYVDPSDNSVTISSASGGNFENLVVDHTAATVHIADTINDTTVSLGVSPASITEAGATVTYTATLTNAAHGDVTVHLDNGQTITIADGHTTGTVDHTFANIDDVYVDPSSSSVAISSASGGNFENLVVDHTAATVSIADTVNDTTVSLGVSPASITEAGATVTYTATLTSAAHGDVTVHLDNGQTITIADGHTTGTVDHTFANTDDVYVDPSNSSVAISSASGGNFENLVVDATPATVQIADTINDTTVSLAVSPASITEAGATVTYTATLTNAAHGDVTVHLDNGQTITIADGHTTGTVDHTFASSDDVYVDPSDNSVTISSASGGNFENLVVDHTAATVHIADTINDTTVSLGVSPASITEAGATVTYTATLTNAAHGDVTVHLDNGQTITIADGHTTGTVDHTFANIDDVYVDPSSSSVAISSASGGNFENLVVDHTAATVSIADTVNDTTVSLAVTPASITEAGATVTYTATLTSAAHGDVTVHLDNGQTITIADGHSTGTVDYTFANSDDVYVDPSNSSVTITSASGGNFENLVVDHTAATVHIADTIDTTGVHISTTNIGEHDAGATFSIHLDNAPQGAATATVDVYDQYTGLTTTHSVNIDGSGNGSLFVALSNPADESITATVTAINGGNYEATSVGATATASIDHGVTLTPVGVSVNEANLSDGSSPAAAALTQSGSLSITALDGVSSVHIGNTDISIAALHDLGSTGPISIDGVTYGQMTVTGYTDTATGGTLQYSFTLSDNVLTPPASVESYVEQVSVSVTDANGSVANSSLGITIVDDHPTFTMIDHAIIGNEDSSTAGVLYGNHDINFGADSIGPINIVGDSLNGKLSYEYTTHADGSVTAAAYSSTDHSAANHFFDLTINTDGTYAFDMVNARATFASGNISLLNVNGGAATNSFALNDATFNAIDTNHNGTIDKTEQLKPTSTGFGVANGNVDTGEQFNVTFNSGIAVDTISLYGKVQAAGSLTMSYITDYLNPDGTTGHDTGSATLDSNGMMHFDPAHDFTSITFAVTSGTGKLDSFSFTERLIPNDETLHFQVSATDGDGDPTGSHSLDVTLLGVHTAGTVIAGTTGSDAMIGTSGNDIFSTGAGHDTIMATKGSDHITDFDVNHDTLDVSSLLANATQSNLVVGNDGANHLKITVVDNASHTLGSVTFDNIASNDTTSINTLLDEVKTHH